MPDKRENDFPCVKVKGVAALGKTKREKVRDAIRSDLLTQLHKSVAIGQYYADLVEDYMSMWDTKNKLIADIQERGVAVENITQAGVNIKKNDSVGDLVRINAQMLKLLSELGIKPAQAEVDGDEEM